MSGFDFQGFFWCKAVGFTLIPFPLLFQSLKKDQFIVRQKKVQTVCSWATSDWTSLPCPLHPTCRPRRNSCRRRTPRRQVRWELPVWVISQRETNISGHIRLDVSKQTSKWWKEELLINRICAAKNQSEAEGSHSLRSRKWFSWIFFYLTVLKHHDRCRKQLS